MKRLLKKNKNIYYLLIIIKFYIENILERIKNYYYKKLNREKIKSYQKYKKERKAKGVVYTCIINNYDTLKTQKYIENDWDYICFTNNSKIKTDGVWEIKNLKYNKLDDTRNNRWHKLNPHLIFKNYDRSLYIDGNIRILSKDFFQILNLKFEKNFIGALHPTRNCLYEEAEICKKLNLESEAIIDKQIEIIKNNDFPNSYGLYEANILYRNHNASIIKNLNEEWWSFVSKLAKRDQLSLTYLCWKYKIPFEVFTDINFRKKNNLIEITPHNRFRKMVLK